MPNGGGTKSRVRATLVGAFALGRELSSGRRLPADGEVYDIDSIPSAEVGQVPKLRFRVVSAAFEGLSSSERSSLVYDILLDSAKRGPLHGAHIQPTGRSEGEFNVVPPAMTLGVSQMVVIDARSHHEASEGEFQPETHQASIETPTSPLAHYVLAEGVLNRQEDATSTTGRTPGRAPLPLD